MDNRRKTYRVAEAKAHISEMLDRGTHAQYGRIDAQTI